MSSQLSSHSCIPQEVKGTTLFRAAALLARLSLRCQSGEKPGCRLTQLRESVVFISKSHGDKLICLRLPCGLLNRNGLLTLAVKIRVNQAVQLNSGFLTRIRYGTIFVLLFKGGHVMRDLLWLYCDTLLARVGLRLKSGSVGHWLKRAWPVETCDTLMVEVLGWLLAYWFLCCPFIYSGCYHHPWQGLHVGWPPRTMFRSGQGRESQPG